MRNLIIAFVLIALCLAGGKIRLNPVQETGDGPAASEAAQGVSLDEYLASVREQSDAIRASLAKDPLSQTDMNMKSSELRELWDAALERLMEEAGKALTAEEMEKLTAEQSAWAEATEKAIEAAGSEFEGGSLYPLIVNTEAADRTEARVHELYEQLK